MTPERILKALSNTEMAVFSQDADLRYRWILNPNRSWLADAQAGQVDGDFLPASAAAYAQSMKSEALQAERSIRFELPVLTDGIVRWYDVRVERERDGEGAIIGIMGSSVEITDQKRREETLRTLLRELSHRSKNLLAIIQSLASQTARNSVTVPEFLVRFRGRVQSLAFSQDIVTEADWQGADLISLVALQVGRYAPDGMDQISVDAPRISLTPTASLHVGLALHELAVNAASYGSLSVPGGTVSIQANFERAGEASQLVLVWQERDGPRVRTDRDARFGTSTLERIVPNAVGGEGRLDYLPDGIRYTLTIPASQYE